MTASLDPRARLLAIRLANQQLTDPQETDPVRLVNRMGAIQAQEYAMAKWAVGIRLHNGRIDCVDQALREGRLVRTHLLRPTWHLVTAGDLRWMLQLSADAIRAACRSFYKGTAVETDEREIGRINERIGKMLEGNRHLTKKEIAEQLTQQGIPASLPHMNQYMVRAEIDGLVCNGADKGSERTYALLDERIAPASPIAREEAIARLAERYFRSHSPATLQDFAWWSGLSISEARKAIAMQGTLLAEEKQGDFSYFIYRDQASADFFPAQGIHFLPPYDEFLVAYKERSLAIDPNFISKAYTRYGKFYPVLLYNGRVAGNWKCVKKSKSKNTSEFCMQYEWFEPITNATEADREKAERKYRVFMQSQ